MDGDPYTLHFPNQTDTVAWARMLAAARGADTMTTDGAQAVDADQRTKKRLGALLPVARELYDEHVRLTAESESLKIENIMFHCQSHLVTLESLFEALGIDYTQFVAAPWPEVTCQREADSLLVTTPLCRIRPAPPDVIGYYLIPQSSVWRLLRDEILRSMSPASKYLRNYYGRWHGDEVRSAPNKHRALHPLSGTQLFKNVFERAPPLVRALPPRWTAADLTDPMHEALQALLKLRCARPLDSLVDMLCKSEHDLLVQEHLCLSQVLDSDAWSPICNDGRTLGEYQAFARFLQNDAGFKGLQPVVQPISYLAKTPRRRNASWLKRKPVPHRDYWFPAAPPETNKPAKRRRYDEITTAMALQSTSDEPARPVQLAAAALGGDLGAKADRLASEQISSVQKTVDAPEDWTRDLDKLPAVHKPLDQGVGVWGNDEPFEHSYLRDPVAERDFSDGMMDLPELSWPFESSDHLPRRAAGGVSVKDFSFGRDIAMLPLARPAPRVGGSLARSDGAKVVSSVSAGPLAVAGAVAAFGLLLVVTLAVRHRTLRVGGRSRASSGL